MLEGEGRVGESRVNLYRPPHGWNIPDIGMDRNALLRFDLHWNVVGRLANYWIDVEWLRMKYFYINICTPVINERPPPR